MRALVYHKTGLVLDRNYPMPAPVDGEALIRVLQAGICNTDLEITRGYLNFQGILGYEFVGIVEAVHESPGATAPTYLLGKRIVGEINAACHLRYKRLTENEPRKPRPFQGGGELALLVWGLDGRG